MKATIEVPDELYRQVKAKSALEGRAVREVTEELFRRYVSVDTEASSKPAAQAREIDGEPFPTWFGALRKYARNARQHDMEAIRESIAAGVRRERGL